MKLTCLYFSFFLLFISQPTLGQISSGSGGGGGAKPTGPSMPDGESTDHCVEEDMSPMSSCHYTNADLTFMHFNLIKLLEARYQKCFGLPIAFENVVHFHNHVMVEFLVRRLAAEKAKFPGCTENDNERQIVNCFLTPETKRALHEFTVFPISLRTFLNETYRLSNEEADAIAHTLKTIGEEE